MQVHTIRLQRVFDVQRDALSKDEMTNFSFETADGRRCLAVQLPGRPRLQAGDTVAAVLAKADNWQTLRGWRNRTNGEVIVRGNLRGPDLMRLAVATGLVLTLCVNASSDSSRTVASVAIMLCAAAAVVFARQQWQALQVLRLLQHQA